MCELCSSDQEEVLNARRNLLHKAVLLEELANDYRKMSRGLLKPHTSQVENVRLKAINIMRDLAMEWL
jgi:hypothetical protein